MFLSIFLKATRKRERERERERDHLVRQRLATLFRMTCQVRLLFFVLFRIPIRRKEDFFFFKKRANGYIKDLLSNQQKRRGDSILSSYLSLERRERETCAINKRLGHGCVARATEQTLYTPLRPCNSDPVGWSVLASTRSRCVLSDKTSTISPFCTLKPLLLLFWLFGVGSLFNDANVWLLFL